MRDHSITEVLRCLEASVNIVDVVEDVVCGSRVETLAQSIPVAPFELVLKAVTIHCHSAKLAHRLPSSLIKRTFRLGQFIEFLVPQRQFVEYLHLIRGKKL